MLITMMGTPACGKTKLVEDFVKGNKADLKIFDKNDVYDLFKTHKSILYPWCVIRYCRVFLMMFFLILVYRNKHLKIEWEIKSFVRALARYEVAKKLIKNSVCNLVIIDEDIRQRLLSLVEKTDAQINSQLLFEMVNALPKPDLLVIIITEKKIIIQRLNDRISKKSFEGFSERERGKRIEKSIRFLEVVGEYYEGAKVYMNRVEPQEVYTKFEKVVNNATVINV